MLSRKVVLWSFFMSETSEKFAIQLFFCQFSVKKVIFFKLDGKVITIFKKIFLTNTYIFQVVKPVNLEALSKWVDHIPDDVIEDMANIAPMLEKMGYDPNANPPKYGIPDDEVIKNTKDIKEHNEVWNKQGEIVKNLSKKDIVGPTG